MTKLGAPSKIYYKSEEKMLIQRSNTGSERLNEDEEDKPDFFFNYFSLGMVGELIYINNNIFKIFD